MMKLLKHFTCEVASKHAINSASIMDDATIIYLALLYDITPPTSMEIYFEVDFLES